MNRLILLGNIGAGKSTLIRRTLGAEAARAGGFITRRVTENGKLLGFDLAPAQVWADPGLPTWRFLDFTRENTLDDSVFSGPGAALLADALQAPFAVADEFGGLELLVPEFYEGLWKLLSSEVPLIGVFKTPEAVKALAARIPLGEAYEEKARALLDLMENDPETCLVPLAGWDDEIALRAVHTWADAHLWR